MCSGSEAGSYLRLIDYVDHSTLNLRVIKKEKKSRPLVSWHTGKVENTQTFKSFQSTR